MKLSLRLQSLLDRCEPGHPVWDLCCDHGLLGLSALDCGFPTVVFNDAVPHVLAELQKHLMGVSNARVLCARAEEIREPLTGNVVMAGVGGEKIFKILSRQIENGYLQARRLLLCPEKDAEWLAQQTIPGYRYIERLALPHGAGVRWIYQMRADSVSND